MTTPIENFWSIQNTRKYLRDILLIRNRNHFAKMTAEEFEQWRQDAGACLKHFPWDHTFQDKWFGYICNDCAEKLGWKRQFRQLYIDTGRCDGCGLDKALSWRSGWLRNGETELTNWD